MKLTTLLPSPFATDSHPTPPRRRLAAAALGAACALALLAGCGGGGGGGGGGGDDDERVAFDYVHVTTQDNVFLGVTVLDHPALNDRPDALPIVTPAYTLPDGRPTNVENPSSVALRYTPGSGRWALVNQRAGVLMPVGQAYHVSVYGVGGEGRALRISIPDDHPNPFGFEVPDALVGPDEVLFVSPTWWDGAREVALRCDTFVATTSAVDGVWIRSLVGAGVDPGHRFHAAALPLGGSVLLHAAHPSNLRGTETELAHPLLDGRPEAILQVTAQTFAFVELLSDPRTIGVAYDEATGRWRLRADDDAVIGADSTFIVHVRR